MFMVAADISYRFSDHNGMTSLKNVRIVLRLGQQLHLIISKKIMQCFFRKEGKNTYKTKPII